MAQEVNSYRPPETTLTSDALLPELVAHLRENRTPLREEWARRITDAGFQSKKEGRYWKRRRISCSLFLIIPAINRS